LAGASAASSAGSAAIEDPAGEGAAEDRTPFQAPDRLDDAHVPVKLAPSADNVSRIVPLAPLVSRHVPSRTPPAKVPLIAPGIDGGPPGVGRYVPDTSLPTWTTDSVTGELPPPLPPPNIVVHSPAIVGAAVGAGTGETAGAAAAGDAGTAAAASTVGRDDPAPSGLAGAPAEPASRRHALIATPPTTTVIAIAQDILAVRGIASPSVEHRVSY
jgi:hypothetical protein